MPAAQRAAGFARIRPQQRKGHVMPQNRNFLYLRLYSELKQAIDSGRLRPGQRIAPEHELMRQYAVRRALAKLESEGYLKRKAAAGTFVRIEKADYGLSRMESFSEQMLRRGLSPSSELLSIQLTADLPAPVRKELGFTGAERAYIISRLRKANGQPMAHEVAYIPCALCPDLHTHLVESTSLYHIYEDIYHLQLGNAQITLEAETPSPALQKLLCLRPGMPVLRMRCTMHLKDGRALYYVTCDYSGEKYVFSVNLTR